MVNTVSRAGSYGKDSNFQAVLFCGSCLPPAAVPAPSKAECPVLLIPKADPNQTAPVYNLISLRKRKADFILSEVNPINVEMTTVILSGFKNARVGNLNE